MNSSNFGDNRTVSIYLLMDKAERSGAMHITNIIKLIVAFFTFLSNSIILLVCFLHRKKELIISRPVISLVVADLLTCLSPFTIVSGFYDQDSYIVCDIATYIYRIGLLGTLTSSVLVSIERFLAVKYASTFKIVFNKRRSNFALAVTWAIPVILGVLAPVVNSGVQICRGAYMFDVALTVSRVVFVVVLSSIALCFYIITYSLIKKDVSNGGKYRRIFETAIIMSSVNGVGLLMVTVFLMNVACGLGEYCGVPGLNFNMGLYLSTPIVVTFTGAINPVVTMVRCAEIRKGMRELLPRFGWRIEPEVVNLTVVRRINVRPAKEDSDEATE